MDRQRSRPLSRRHLLAGGAGAVGATVALGGTSVGAAGGGPTPGQLIVLAEPIRLFDSRDASNFFGGNKLADGGAVSVFVGAPGSDWVASAFVNLTITATEGAGYLAVRASDTADDVQPPETSNINWTAPDVTLANLVLSQVGVENSIDVFCVGPGAATHVIVDLQGYVPLEFPPEKSHHDKDKYEDKDKDKDKDKSKYEDKDSGTGTK